MTHDKALYKSTITLTLSLAGTHFHRVEGRRLLAWVVGNTPRQYTHKRSPISVLTGLNVA